MQKTTPVTPRFTPEEAVELAAAFGVRGTAHPLPSYQDQNFRIRSEGPTDFVLKIGAEGIPREELQLQNAALEHIAASGWNGMVPRLVRTTDGNAFSEAHDPAGHAFDVRLLTWVEGELRADQPSSPELHSSLGGFLAGLHEALSGFDHPSSRRPIQWDLRRSADITHLLPAIGHPERRNIADRFRSDFERHTLPRLDQLPSGVIHNDANDYNLLVAESEDGERAVAGIIDFGDLLHAPRVCELAIGAAYALLDSFDPLDVAGQVVRGYHERMPLTEDEVEVLFPLIAMRLVTTVVMAANERLRDPDNEYISVHESSAWRALEQLACIPADRAIGLLREACGLGTPPPDDRSDLRRERELRLGKALSLSYAEPLEIVRGSGAWLFDARGRAFLDCVNNVCHVGHCHPHVVRAATDQVSVLNTNTRYLHRNIVEYARRLTAKLPDPLSVCYFVCTGSEANELALRMARAHTGRRDVVVIDGAYHGNASSLIDLSPYKFDGPGGEGCAPHVHVAAAPDPFRGPYGQADPEAGKKYGQHVGELARAAAANGSPIAAYYAEALLGCGGQIVPPTGYLQTAFDAVREAGGLCIADEVQIGFGRVGSHFWGFESQGVVPDIVTMGKPMGNGHPLAAVVTTPEIATSFAGGMEYFNTFGGNPVSCAIGLAVLDVIEDEELQANAERVGSAFRQGLEGLMPHHRCIGEVRGLGLFLGVELIKDRETREPDAGLADAVVERMKQRGILLSTDGPLHNVIKIKPPIVFTLEHAEHVVGELDDALKQLA